MSEKFSNQRQSDGTAAPEPVKVNEPNGGCHARLVGCSSFSLSEVADAIGGVLRFAGVGDAMMNGERMADIRVNQLRLVVFVDSDSDPDHPQLRAVFEDNGLPASERIGYALEELSLKDLARVSGVVQREEAVQ